MVLGLVLFLVGGYVVLCLVLRATQERLVYFPGAPPSTTPASAGLEFEDVALRTSDGETLGAWLVRAKDARGGVVLCHGNAGSIEHRIGLARSLASQGFDVLLFDYRGYGTSTGAPSEEGTYIDGVAAFDALAARLPGRVAVFGESLGGGVAIELALRRKVAAVVVEATFTSLVDVGQRVYWWLPVSLISRLRYESITKIGRIEAPVLVAHSPDDDLVPFAMGEALFAAAKGPKQFLRTRGVHNEGGIKLDRASVEAVGAFLREHVSAR